MIMKAVAISDSRCWANLAWGKSWNSLYSWSIYSLRQWSWVWNRDQSVPNIFSIGERCSKHWSRRI